MAITQMGEICLFIDRFHALSKVLMVGYKALFHPISGPHRLFWLSLGRFVSVSAVYHCYVKKFYQAPAYARGKGGERYCRR